MPPGSRAPSASTVQGAVAGARGSINGRMKRYSFQDCRRSMYTASRLWAGHEVASGSALPSWAREAMPRRPIQQVARAAIAPCTWISTQMSHQIRHSSSSSRSASPFFEDHPTSSPRASARRSENSARDQDPLRIDQHRLQSVGTSMPYGTEDLGAYEALLWQRIRKGKMKEQESEDSQGTTESKEFCSLPSYHGPPPPPPEAPLLENVQQAREPTTHGLPVGVTVEKQNMLVSSHLGDEVSNLMENVMTEITSKGLKWEPSVALLKERLESLTGLAAGKVDDGIFEVEANTLLFNHQVKNLLKTIPHKPLIMCTREASDEVHQLMDIYLSGPLRGPKEDLPFELCALQRAALWRFSNLLYKYSSCISLHEEVNDDLSAERRKLSRRAFTTSMEIVCDRRLKLSSSRYLLKGLESRLAQEFSTARNRRNKERTPDASSGRSSASKQSALTHNLRDASMEIEKRIDFFAETIYSLWSQEGLLSLRNDEALLESTFKLLVGRIHEYPLARSRDRSAERVERTLERMVAHLCALISSSTTTSDKATGERMLMATFSKLVAKIRCAPDSNKPGRSSGRAPTFRSPSPRAASVIDRLFFNVLPWQQRSYELHLLLLTRFGEHPLVDHNRQRTMSETEMEGESRETTDLDAKVWRSLQLMDHQKSHMAEHGTASTTDEATEESLVHNTTTFLARFISHAFHGNAQATLEDMAYMQRRGLLSSLWDLPNELLAYAGKAFTLASTARFDQSRKTQRTPRALGSKGKAEE